MVVIFFLLCYYLASQEKQAIQEKNGLREFKILLKKGLTGKTDYGIL